MAKTKDKSPKNGNSRQNFTVPAPPDGGYGWVVVFASFTCNMISDGIAYCFGIFLKDLVEYFNESPAKVSWVGSALAGVTMVAGPIASSVADRFGCRNSCIIGAILTATSFALSVLSPNVEVLMLLFGVMGGIGFGFVYVPAVVCVGYYFESKRSLATGIAVCGSGFGMVVFAPLGTFLLATFGWKGAVLSISGICLTCIPLGLMMKPIEFKVEEDVHDEEEEHKVAVVYQNGNRIHHDDIGTVYPKLSELAASKQSLTSNKSKRSHVLAPLARQDVFYAGSVQNLAEFQSQKSLHDFRQSMVNIPKQNTDKDRSLLYRMVNKVIDISLFNEPAFVAIALVNLFGFLAAYTPFVYIVEIVTKKGISTEKASLLISFMGISNTIGRVVSGFIADFPKVNTLMVNYLCIFMMAISLGTAIFCESYLSYSIMAFVYGSSMAGFISLASILLVDFLGLERLTSAFGNLIFFRGTGALLGPPLAGIIINFSNYDYALGVTAIFLLISGSICASIPMIQKMTKKKDAKVDVEATSHLHLERIEETA